MSATQPLIDALKGSGHQPIQAQAAAARLQGDERSIISLQFPVSNDPVITAMSGIQGVLEAMHLDNSEGRIVAHWLYCKFTRQLPDPGYAAQTYGNRAQIDKAYGLSNIKRSMMGALPPELTP